MVPARLFTRILAAVLCASALLLALPAAARASTPVLQRIDARIFQAEQQTLRWDGRLNSWQSRVAKAAVRLEHVLASPHRSQSRPADYFDARNPSRYRLPAADPLTRARTALRRALHDRKATQARQQATTWRRYMVRLKAARRQVLAAGRGAGVTGLPSGPVTYRKWSRALLSSLKAPACRSNMRVVVAWETAESTLARYNPLATTYVLPGATPSNTSGVQDFVSFAQGIEATRNTLLADPGSLNYVDIVDDLLACAPARKTATAVWNSQWCDGCAKGAYLINQIGAIQADWPEYATRLVTTW
jgi:hypothetical protein